MGTQIGVTISNIFDYELYESSYNGVICGYEGSIAQIYANTFDISFISLSTAPKYTTAATTTTSATTITTITSTDAETPPTPAVAETTKPASTISPVLLGDVDTNGMVDSSDLYFLLSADLFEMRETDDNKDTTTELM